MTLQDDPGRDAPDPLIDAFVDGELTGAEYDRALARLDADPAFRRRVCEARAVKEMVRGAYPPAAVARPARWGGGQALAAGLLLTLGLGAGWLARDVRDPAAAANVQRLAGLPAGYQPVSLAQRVDPGKVVLHLDSRDPERLAQALDLTEGLLARSGGVTDIEVVVNSYGLDLLRADVTPHRQRIERLARQHANLSFIACGQTVARLRRDGTQVNLVPEAVLAPSAIGEILGRMQEGWVYVKV